jgi:hypothetical protein
MLHPAFSNTGIVMTSVRTPKSPRIGGGVLGVLTICLGFSNALVSGTEPIPVVDDGGRAALAARISDNLSNRSVLSVETMISTFRTEQVHWLRLSPPLADFKLNQDCGLMVFDSKSFPAEFTKKMIGKMKYDCPVYTLIIAEDPVTREIMFANADGQEIGRVKAESGYNPYWLLEWQYPELYTGLYSAQEIEELQRSFDPSRIQITVTLLPADYLRQYAEAVATERAKQAVLTPAGGGGIMMRHQGPPVEDLKWVGIERQTNGVVLTLAYPNDFTNRVDVFTCADLVASWWDLALNATNVNTSTNWIEWVDTTALSQSLRFYAAGNADLDSDNDGLADAREKFMYHTCATNSDSDGDGLSDYDEIMTLNTDPNHSKTNKPIVWISHPANEGRKVWLP